jgi:hypothetical protein
VSGPFSFPGGQLVAICQLTRPRGHTSLMAASWRETLGGAGQVKMRSDANGLLPIILHRGKPFGTKAESVPGREVKICPGVGEF